MGDFVLGGFGPLGDLVLWDYIRWDFILGDLVRERSQLKSVSVLVRAFFLFLSRKQKFSLKSFT